jgi:DNA-binding transcriptional ArsR family regulator
MPPGQAGAGGGARAQLGRADAGLGRLLVSTPLYQLKAEFFKTLGHPARIRVLELLSEREYVVAEMLPEVGLEPAHLSQQLAVLRRAGLVTSRKEGSTVLYSLTNPHVAELLAVARLILTEVLSGQAELLDDLRASPR